MTAITNLTFSISSPDGTNAVLDVSYSVQQSALERFLGDAGLGFEECIEIVGGGADGAADQVLHTFPSQLVIFDLGELVATRSRSLTVPRPDHPERLSARVEVRYVGLDTVPARADCAIHASAAPRESY